MRYSNKRKDFIRNKNYVLYGGSENCKKTLFLFCDIADEIGMPVQMAIGEFLLFVKAKSHKNCLIATLLFGSHKRANRYIQGLNKKTFSVLEKHIEQFRVLKKLPNFKINSKVSNQEFQKVVSFSLEIKDKKEIK